MPASLPPAPSERSERLKGEARSGHVALTIAEASLVAEAIRHHQWCRSCAENGCEHCDACFAEEALALLSAPSPLAEAPQEAMRAALAEIIETAEDVEPSCGSREEQDAFYAAIESGRTLFLPALPAAAEAQHDIHHEHRFRCACGASPPAEAPQEAVDAVRRLRAMYRDDTVECHVLTEAIEAIRHSAPPAAPEAVPEAMRQALLGTAAWTLGDGTPCWCGTCPPIEEDGDEHMPECLAARSALSLGDEGERIQREAHERLMASPDCGGLYANPPPAASEAVPADDPMEGFLTPEQLKEQAEIARNALQSADHRYSDGCARVHVNPVRYLAMIGRCSAPSTEASVERLVKAARAALHMVVDEPYINLRDALSAFGAAEGGER